MMVTNGISGILAIVLKVVFSKNASLKSYGVIYILRWRQRPYCVFTPMSASTFAKEANEMLSSTINTRLVAIYV